MKSLVYGSLALLGAGTGALAADLPSRQPPPVPALGKLHSWAGFYVGGHGGYASTSRDTSLSSVIGPVLTLDVANGVFPRRVDGQSDGAIGGVQAGYNLQIGKFVVGLEADASWLDSRVTTRFSAVDPGPIFPGALTNSSYQSDVDWLSTVRARAGLAFDRTLIYVTGGLAIGDVKNTFSVGIPSVGYTPPPWSNRGVELGWSAGAGLEYAITDSISLKAEYLHYDLGQRVLRATDAAVFPGQFLNYGFATSGEIGRVGFNVKF